MEFHQPFKVIQVVLELQAVIKMVLNPAVAVVLVEQVKLEILVLLVVDMVVKVELEYKIILQLV
jgi:hypothetical protein